MQTKTIVIISLAIIGFYLLAEHRVHIFGNAQYILFVVFIIMHLFMYGGHGGHGSHGAKEKEKHHG